MRARCQPRQEGSDGERDDPEDRVEPDADGEHADQEEHRGGEGPERLSEHVADGVDVTRHARRQVGRLAPLAKREREALQVAVDRSAQIVHDEVAGAPQALGRERGGQPVEQGDGDGEHGHRGEQGPVAPLDCELPPAVGAQQAVDDELQRERPRQLGGDDHDRRAQRGDDRAPMPAGR